MPIDRIPMDERRRRLIKIVMLIRYTFRGYFGLKFANKWGFYVDRHMSRKIHEFQDWLDYPNGDHVLDGHEKGIWDTLRDYQLVHTLEGRAYQFGCPKTTKMSSPSHSSRLVHMWVVTGTVYLTGICLTWPITHRQMTGLFESKRARKTIERSHFLGAIVTLGFAVYLPLSCVQMFYFDMAEDQALTEDGNNDEWLDYLNEPMAWGFGIPAFIAGMIAALSDLSLNISKLDIFDGTISEVSTSMKQSCYVSFVFLALVVPAWGWLFLLDVPDEWLFAQLALGYVGWLILDMVLAYRFASGLRAFLELTRRQSSVYRTTMSAVNNGSTMDHNAIEHNAPNLSLLRVIIRQSLLSMVKLLSYSISVVILVLSITVTEGLLTTYLRIGTVQVAVSLPLCVFLSFDFASNEYDYLCGRIHQWIEHFALVP